MAVPSFPVPAATRAAPTSRAERWAHLLAVPLAFAAAGELSARTGLDHWLAQAAYDPAVHGFPLRRSMWLELFGHQLANSAVWLTWLALVAAAIAGRWLPALRRWRGLLATTAVAMALGPAIVVVLKDINTHACPWNLQAYGGSAAQVFHWFVPRSEAGRCFPGGHAAGGYSVVALAYAALAAGRRDLAVRGFWGALIAGALFGAVRMAQGAHFLSHNLWSAAIDWSVAGLVFLPWLTGRWRLPVGATTLTAPGFGPAPDAANLPSWAEGR